MKASELKNWLQETGSPDRWFVAVDGTVEEEIYSLRQVQILRKAEPQKTISVVHEAQGGLEPVPWVEFAEAKPPPIPRDRAKPPPMPKVKEEPQDVWLLGKKLPKRGEFETNATKKQLEYLEQLGIRNLAELKLGKYQASEAIDSIKKEYARKAKDRDRVFLLVAGIGIVALFVGLASCAG